MEWTKPREAVAQIRMKWNSLEEEQCSVARTIAVIGDRWTLLVLRDCFLRVRRFEDFQARLGLTRHVLADRLKKLVRHGVLRRVPYQTRPKRHEYILTQTGLDLYPIIMAIVHWGDIHMVDERGRPRLYEHKPCGQSFEPVMVCSACGQKLSAKDVHIHLGPGASEQDRLGAARGANPAKRAGQGEARESTKGSIAVEQHLLEAISDGVVTLTLNRPDRLNALSTPMLEALLEALPRLGADAAVGAIVLTGAGRAFCAGGDVKSMAEGRTGDRSPGEAVAHLRGRMEVARLLHEIPKPTIAMINGAAAGAGLALALACDMRMAAQSARLITAFAKVGFSGDFGGSYFLSKLVGTGKARELYYMVEPIDAAEALALGIVNRVAPDPDLAEITMQVARKLARGPRIALALMKQNFNAAETATLVEMLDLEARHQIETGRTDDHKEAARAFVEKRVPVFTGR
jgi:2-(1,2-epoxy-1,2-dihydrophenyl)acetyl-CoA isomerase